MMASKPFVFRFDDVEVREREFTLIKASKVLTVEPKAFRALLFLLHNPQRFISKEELLNTVWGDAAVTEGSLTRCISLLRSLLGDDIRQPRYIATVATVGYRFVCKVEVSRTIQEIWKRPVSQIAWNPYRQGAGEGPEAAGSERGGDPHRPATIEARHRIGARGRGEHKGQHRKPLTKVGRHRRCCGLGHRVCGGRLVFHPRKVGALRDTDSIVLIDFANSTGDPVFDDTLKQGLATELQQSPSCPSCRTER